MPLIIFVLIVIVLFVSLKDSSKRAERSSANYDYNRRKTNARLEQKLIDYYMKHGVSFEKAFDLSRKEIMEKGFEPCVPKEAYINALNEFQLTPISYCYLLPSSETSYCPDIDKYDSMEVRDRREKYGDDDSMVYKNFPKTQFEYVQGLKARTYQLKAIDKGEYVFHPRLGTCEVLGHDYAPSGTRGTYILKVIKTDRIDRSIRIDDKQLQRVEKSRY